MPNFHGKRTSPFPFLVTSDQAFLFSLINGVKILDRKSSLSVSYWSSPSLTCFCSSSFDLFSGGKPIMLRRPFHASMALSVPVLVDTKHSLSEIFKSDWLY